MREVLTGHFVWIALGYFWCVRPSWAVPCPITSQSIWIYGVSRKIITVTSAYCKTLFYYMMVFPHVQVSFQVWELLLYLYELVVVFTGGYINILESMFLIWERIFLVFWYSNSCCTFEACSSIHLLAHSHYCILNVLRPRLHEAYTVPLVWQFPTKYSTVKP